MLNGYLSRGPEHKGDRIAQLCIIDPLYWTEGHFRKLMVKQSRHIKLDRGHFNFTEYARQEFFCSQVFQKKI